MQAFKKIQKGGNKELIKTYSFRASGIILVFALNIVLSRIYGIDMSGQYYTAYNFMTLASSLAFLGFGYVIVHYITPCYSRQSNVYLGNLLLSISVYTIIVTILIVSLVMVLGINFFSEYLYGNSNYKNCILLSCFAMLPYVAILTLAELLKSLKKPNRSIVAANVVSNLIFILLLLIKTDIKNIACLLFLYAISNIIAFIILIVVNYNFFYKNSIQIYSLKNTIQGFYKNKDRCIQFQKENLTLAIVSIANAVLGVFDTLVISSMLTSADVAIYSIANKVISFGGIILTTMNALIGFKIADLSYRGDKKGLANILIHYTRIMIPLGICYYIFAVGFAFLIPYIFGPDYYSSIAISILLAIGQFITIATGPCSYFAIMTGHGKKYLQIVLCSAIISIITNLIFVPYWGVYGSVIGNLAALLYKNLRTFLFTKQQMNIKFRQFFTIKEIQNHEE